MNAVFFQSRTNFHALFDIEQYILHQPGQHGVETCHATADRVEACIAPVLKHLGPFPLKAQIDMPGTALPGNTGREQHHIGQGT